MDPLTPSESEISLGRELRRAREVRGISLEQIAAETKISERYLQALEGDRLDQLPGEIYARNFVRAYARYIGADEEELLDYLNYQLRQHVESTGQGGAEGASASRRRGLAAVGLGLALLLIVSALLLSLHAGSKDKEPPSTSRQTSPVTPVSPAPRPEEPPPTAPVPGPGGASALVAPPPVLVQPSRDATPSGTSGVPGAVKPPTDVPTPAGPTAPLATVPTGPAAPPAEQSPVVKLVFNDESWVEVRREGDAAPTVGLQKRGTAMTYKLDQPLSVFVGNAGAVALFIDGQAAKPLGAPREGRKFTLDRRNVRSYLP